MMMCFFYTSTLLNSCNDAPTTIGTSFLQDTLTHLGLTEDDGIIIDFNSYHYYSPLERNTGISLVGITDKYKATTFIRFIIPVDKKDFKVDDFISCELFLPLDNYYIGDSNSKQLNIDIVEVTNK